MFHNLSEEEEAKLNNGWWYNFRSPSKEWRANPTYDNFAVRLCTGCNKAWQRLSIWAGSIEYLPNFPTYKIPRRHCKHCEAKHD